MAVQAYLYIEEAIFLAETTRLLVMHGGKVLSIQELHVLLVSALSLPPNPYHARSLKAKTLKAKTLNA
eukprot:9475936-Pyramimonas_sp.AAC.1